MREYLNTRDAFIVRLRRLAAAHDVREAWAGFLTASFCSLCQTEEEVRLAEMLALEARHTPDEYAILAEMFALARKDVLEEVHRSIGMGEREAWATGLLQYILRLL